VRDRFDYAEATSRSWKDQMLLSLMKLRSADATVFPRPGHEPPKIWGRLNDETGPHINQLFLQPLRSDNPPNGWAIVTAPGITANGSAPLG